MVKLEKFQDIKKKTYESPRMYFNTEKEKGLMVSWFYIKQSSHNFVDYEFILILNIRHQTSRPMEEFQKENGFTVKLKANNFYRLLMEKKFCL